MTSGGKSGRIIQPSIRNRSRPAFHSFAAVAQWQSISLVMRRLWVRFPPAAPKKKHLLCRCFFFGYLGFFKLLGRNKFALRQGFRLRENACTAQKRRRRCAAESASRLCSAGRPGHVPAGQHVEVQVRHTLARLLCPKTACGLWGPVNFHARAK